MADGAMALRVERGKKEEERQKQSHWRDLGESVQATCVFTKFSSSRRSKRWSLASPETSAACPASAVLPLPANYSDSLFPHQPVTSLPKWKTPASRPLSHARNLTEPHLYSVARPGVSLQGARASCLWVSFHLGSIA